jgi:uncharacterized protein (DUF58 family)
VIPQETMRQIRRLQLRARRAVQTLLGGEYRSVFKGSGLSFEEVREYQPGDEVRTIDWNVTARVGSPFIKRFVEERELTVLLLVDLSGSHDFGSRRPFKRDVIAELASLIAFSANANRDRVGLVGFTDRTETFVPPGKGNRHILRLLRDILQYRPEGRKTSLRGALSDLVKTQRKRAVVFLFSDFLDVDYEATLGIAARKHDLIVVRVSDPLEVEFPDLGMIQLQDAETGEQLLVDSRNASFRDAYRERLAAKNEAFAALMRSHKIDTIEATTDGKHFDALVKFFELRERRGRRR